MSLNVWMIESIKHQGSIVFNASKVRFGSSFTVLDLDGTSVVMLQMRTEAESVGCRNPLLSVPLLYSDDS
jgi:hypothetical protein